MHLPPLVSGTADPGQVQLAGLNVHDFEPQDLHDLAQGYCDDELHVRLPELLVHGCQNFEARLKPDIQVSQSTGCPLRAAWHQTVIHKQEGLEQGHGVDGQMVQ